MVHIARLDSDQRWNFRCLDACPLEPETYNMFQDTDGCPDSVEGIPISFPDTDGDGIEDRWDSCIDEPENFNGFLDFDGCPEIPGTTAGDMLDADYDGIADHLDQLSNYCRKI